jgi:Rad3-related DNA helicase
MGGVFSEGIDLSGNRLIGAAIVGTGVPQLSLRGDTLRDIYEKQYGSGYAYAYLYPGLSRVFQAAGRVIRSETDRGMVLLLDDRFGTGFYRSLFPAHWRHAKFLRSQEAVTDALTEFWSSDTEPQKNGP